MSTPTSPPRLSAAALRRAGWPNGGLRVSDADRGEVADQLAKHYSDGRLDQAEFDQRLDQAMRAKTQADLVGLLADLPDGTGFPPPDDSGPRAQRRRQRQLLKLQLERERLMLKHEQRENRRRERAVRLRSLRQLPVIILVIVLAIVAAAVLRHYAFWLMVAVIGFLWLRHADISRRR
jgi:Domain of unknown function (DUF1707)